MTRARFINLLQRLPKRQGLLGKTSEVLIVSHTAAKDRAGLYSYFPAQNMLKNMGASWNYLRFGI